MLMPCDIRTIIRQLWMVNLEPAQVDIESLGHQTAGQHAVCGAKTEYGHQQLDQVLVISGKSFDNVNH